MKKTILLLAFFLVGCSSAAPTPQPLADSAFSAYAFVDSNANGQLDAEDAPLEDAIFSVSINGVKAFREKTDKSGNAFILVPSAVEYPVALSMEAPQDSGLHSIGASEVLFSAGDDAPKFLFSSSE
ncbi:MAG: hypothetical protein LC099_12230 [Anaerolineales bacterium]|nr:hypothetical protein [Anaerolineales bacterium]